MGTKWDKAKDTVVKLAAGIAVLVSLGVGGNELMKSGAESIIKNDLSPKHKKVLMQAVKEGLSESDKRHYARVFWSIQERMKNIETLTIAADTIIAQESRSIDKPNHNTMRTVYINRISSANEFLKGLPTDIEELDKPAFESTKKELIDAIREQSAKLKSINEKGNVVFKY